MPSRKPFEKQMRRRRRQPRKQRLPRKQPPPASTAAKAAAAEAAAAEAAAAAAKEQLETAAIEWDEEVFNERVLATVKSTAKWNPPKAGKQSACRRAALRLGRKHLLRLLAASDVDHDDVRGKVQCFFKLAKVLLKKDGIKWRRKPSKTPAAVGQFRTATE